jgi:hypothetical protein
MENGQFFLHLPIDNRHVSYIFPQKKNPRINKGCVTLWPCHFTFKKEYLKAREELWKLKYFTMQKIHLIFKKSSKRNQNGGQGQLSPINSQSI